MADAESNGLQRTAWRGREMTRSSKQPTTWTSAASQVEDREAVWRVETATHLLGEAGQADCGPPGLTGDTLEDMAHASIRELRNRGGEVVDRVRAGEVVTITRDGEPVAELRPLPRQPLNASALVERFRRLPPVDAARLRADVDAVVDQSL